MKKIGVVRFLGTNCDFDVFEAVKSLKLDPEWLWFEDRFNIQSYSALVIPGGFSYGDYLRCGALAARSPVMKDVSEAAKKGVPVLGICNGFQILCESGLLPGALVRNQKLKFIDDWVELKGFVTKGVWKKSFAGKNVIKLPIAHGEGRFYHENPKSLFESQQVLCTYVSNPNGALMDIAGVTNESGNVAALMPHPERAMLEFQGGTDGRSFFEGLL